MPPLIPLGSPLRMRNVAIAATAFISGVVLFFASAKVIRPGFMDVAEAPGLEWIIILGGTTIALAPFIAGFLFGASIRSSSGTRWAVWSSSGSGFVYALGCVPVMLFVTHWPETSGFGSELVPRAVFIAYWLAVPFILPFLLARLSTRGRQRRV